MAEYFGLYRKEDKTEPVESQTRTGENILFDLSPDEEGEPKTLYAIGDESQDRTKDYGFEEFTVTPIGDTSDKWEFRKDETDSWSKSITITGIDAQVQSFQIRASSDDVQTLTDESVEIEIDAQMVLV